MTRYDSPLIALAVVVFLAACGDDTGSRAGTVTRDTLPNGTVLVRNAETGAWDSASAWTFAEEVRIGAVEGTGPDVFGAVHDLDVDAYGRAWVLDRQEKRVEVFDARGRHVRTVGRGGAGPGELEEPTGAAFDPAWRLWVEDPRNARYTVFDSTGAPATTYRRDSMMYGWSWLGGITRGGRVFAVDLKRLDTGETERVLIERDSTGAVVDTFALPVFEEHAYLLQSNGRTRMAAGVPFSPSLGWTVADDGTMWFGSTGEYRLIQRTLEGDTVRIVEKDWHPIPVRPAERDSALARDFYEQMRAQGADVDPARVPAHKPAWSSVTLDDRGYLWVFPLLETPTRRAVDVFDPEGVYLGRVALPDGTQLQWPTPTIRGDRLYAVVRDDMDVQYVVVGRLRGRAND